MILTRSQKEVLEQLTWGTKMSAFLPRTRIRTVQVLERRGLVVCIERLLSVTLLGRYRLTSRGWAAAGRAPCRAVG